MSIHKYYKDILNNVYAYAADGSEDDFIGSGFTQITEEEADILRAPFIPSSENHIAAAHERINSAYEAAVADLTAGYPQSEIASWDKQEAEARALYADGNAVTPWIDGAAAARGIDRIALAVLIISNANALLPFHGALTGKRQKLRDAIDALGSEATQEQLDAIQW